MIKHSFTGINRGTCIALTYRSSAWGCGRYTEISVSHPWWSQETDSPVLLPWQGWHWPLG